MASKENSIEMEKMGEKQRLLGSSFTLNEELNRTREPTQQHNEESETRDDAVWLELLEAFAYLEDINKITNIMYQYEDSICHVVDSENTSLLDLAVMRQSMPLVKALLHANGNTPTGQLEQALCKAFHDWNPELDQIAAFLVKALPNERVRELMFNSDEWFGNLADKGFTETLAEVLNSMIDEDGLGADCRCLEAEVNKGSQATEEAGNPLIQWLKKSDPYTHYQSFALNNNVDVVNSDIYRLLTKQKWTTFARKVLGFQITLFLLSIFLLTYIAITSVATENVMVYDGPVQQARLVFEIIIFVFVVIRIFNEMAQLKRSREKYFWDFYNIIETSSAILFILVLPLRFYTAHAHWHCFSIGYGLYMTNIFKYSILFRSTGVHTQILWHILKHDVIQFSILFFVVNLAFGGGFFLMLQADKDLLQNADTSTFHGIMYVGLRTLVQGEPVIEYTGASAFGIMSTCVLLLFLFLTVVILLNILIAQVNNTYQKIQNDADRQYELNLAKYISWLEINTCIFPCLKFCRDRQVLLPESMGNVDVPDRKGPTALEKVKGLVDHVVQQQTKNEGQMAKFLSKLAGMQMSVTSTNNWEIPNSTLRETFANSVWLLSELKSINSLKDQYLRKLSHMEKHMQSTEELLKYILEFVKVSELKSVDRKYEPSTLSGIRTIDITPLDDLREAGDRMCVADKARSLLTQPIRDFTDGEQRQVEHELYEFLGERKQEDVLGYLKSKEKKQPGVTSIPFFVDGETVMHIAAKRGFYYAVDFLIKNGAPINIPSENDQKLPLQRALGKPYDDTAVLIAKYMTKGELRTLFTRADAQTPPILSLKDYLDHGCPKFLNLVLDSMIDCGEVYYNVLESDSQGFVPNELDFDENDETVFHKIARMGKMDTVNHRVVKMLLEKKWKNFARGRFIFQMIMYLVSLVALTVSAVLGVITDDVREYNTPKDGTRAVFEVAIYAFVCLMCLHEIWKLKRKRLRYIKSNDTLDGITTLLLLSLLPVRYINVNGHWYLFSIGYLLWAIRIFKYAAIFRTWGAYAQTLWMIIKRDVIQFSVLFLVVNLAFSGTYFLALKADDDLSRSSEISTFHGVFYAGLQTVTKGGPVIDYADGYGYFNTAIQMMFLFVTLVILLNILIAQLSNTYTNIQEDAQRALHVRMARIVVSVQHGVLSFCRQTDVKNFYIPSEPIHEAAEEQTRQLMEVIAEEVHYLCDNQVSNQLKMLDLDSGIKELDHKTTGISARVNEQGLKITAMHETLRETTSISMQITENWSDFSTNFNDKASELLQRHDGLKEQADKILKCLEDKKQSNINTVDVTDS